MAIDKDAIYTPNQVAGLLCCGKSNVYDLLGAGDLAVTRIGAKGKCFRIRGSDILAFLDERKTGGPQPRVRYKLLGL